MEMSKVSISIFILHPPINKSPFAEIAPAIFPTIAMEQPQSTIIPEGMCSYNKVTSMCHIANPISCLIK